MATNKIVIDLYGSDEGPTSVARGGALLLNAHEDVNVIFVGDENIIKPTMEENNIDPSRYEIIHTTEQLTNMDNIMEAFFKKPNASVILAIQELANNEDTIGLLTAGNSGAIVVGSIKYLSTQDMARPCMAAILPAVNGGFVCLVDTGSANDCTPSQLHQFAKLGSDFMRNLYKIESPKVGLLSNGVEPTKGNKLVKETYHILEEDKSLNFVGNLEGSNCLSGEADVLVCDGFAGNQVLKVTEGTVARIIRDIVIFSKKNNQPQLMQLVGHLAGMYDISALGGAVVLGARKTIIKCRGNSKDITFKNTGEMLINIKNNKTFFEGKDIR